MFITKSKVLVVDDEESILSVIAKILKPLDMEVILSQAATEALEKIKNEDFDAVITDIRMPQVDGYDILKVTKEKDDSIPVIMITGYGSIDSAVEAMKKGAYDYITKPFSKDEFLLTVQRAIEKRRLVKENIYLHKEIETKYRFENIVGQSPQMLQIFEVVKVIAPTNASVLITGETGTGKELIARAIHYNSPRRDKPFIDINCAALTETLLESELFGHEKGAFTGAISSHAGRFELANGGTVLLDEISEMSPHLQAKLLRVLQERTFQRVGGTRTISVDVRVIATTNKDLKKALSEGLFREDLYHRLNVVHLELPPLRERRSDIPLLVHHFLEKFTLEHKRSPMSITPRALELLEKYPWPGNVRELSNCLEKMVIMSKRNVILPEELLCHIISFDQERASSSLWVGLTVKEMEKQLILMTLKEVGGNKTKAAKILGISLRSLHNKIKEYSKQ